MLCVHGAADGRGVGPNQKKALSPAPLTALLFCGVLLAPGKLVLSAAGALLLLVPAARLGHHARAKKCAYLAACLALALLLNTGLLTDTLRSGQTAVQTTAAEDADRVVKSRPAEPDEAYEAGDLRREYAGKLRQAAVLLRGRQPQPRGTRGRILGAGHAGGRRQPGGAGAEFPLFARQGQQLHRRPGILHDGLLCAAGHRCDRRQRGRYLPYFAEGGAVQAYKQLFNLTSCVESFAALGVDVGTMDDRIPLDRTVLAQEVEAARATRSTQSTADEADKATYTPGYILRHPVDTVLLFVRSAVENGDHYIRTLVGGSLSYYTVDLAWGWVAVLYLLLAYAALPVQGAVMKPPVRRAAGAARRRRSAACWPWPGAFCGHPPITTRCTACRGGTSCPCCRCFC